jgi:hypothetical protein
MQLLILTQKNRKAVMILAIALLAGAAVSRIPFDGLSEAGRHEGLGDGRERAIRDQRELLTAARRCISIPADEKDGER